MLSKKILDQIFKHVVNEYPHEGCGVVTANQHDAAGQKFWPCPNIQGELHKADPDNYPRDASTAYYIDPKELGRIYYEANKWGQVVTCIFHSHPDQMAYFSREDHDGAFHQNQVVNPEAVHLVISVVLGVVKDHNYFRYNPDVEQFEKL